MFNLDILQTAHHRGDSCVSGHLIIGGPATKIKKAGSSLPSLGFRILVMQSALTYFVDSVIGAVGFPTIKLIGRFK